MKISTMGYTFKQGVKNIRRNKMFSIASIATMAACIFLFGVFYSLLMNFSHTIQKAEETVGITVFFDEDITSTRKDAIKATIEGLEGVKEVKYVTKEEAWDDFVADYFEGNEELAEGFKENPLGNSDHFVVTMSDVAQQQSLVDETENMSGVRKVNRSDVVAKTFTSVNRLISVISFVIIGILLAVAIFLISNTVTMGITVRREEIAIMKYIGAKDNFVRAPFVIEGLIIGVVGAVIPLTILYFSYEAIITYVKTKFSLLNNLITFLPVNEVYRTLLPVGLLLGVGIGFLGSSLTIRKHLRV